MKMYEKLGMSTEDALKWVEECAKRNCLDCPAYKIAQRTETIVFNCAPNYLLSDVPKLRKIPRWQTAKTQEDFDKLFDGFEKVRKGTCEDCKYYEICNPTEDNIKDCYHAYLHAYLSELVDAPESEDENG